jgi:co-chaperonin GroES (HSP10)
MNPNTLRPTRNNVLVKLDKNYSNEIDLGVTTIEIPIDANNTSHFVSTEGVVVKVPESLNQSPWKTTIQVKEGDHVYFTYNALREAMFQKGSTFVHEGDLYAIINYHTLIATKSNNRITPLNGFCFVEPVKEHELPEGIRKKVSSLDLPHPKTSARFGRMILQAKPNLGYDNQRDQDILQNIPEGSIVMFATKTDVLVQYSLQATLYGKKEIYRIQSRFFLAVIL